MLIVMKFGGSLLGSKGGVNRVAKIVANHSKENRVVTVVSALGDVTDLLLELAEDALAGGKRRRQLFEGLKMTHDGALAQLSKKSRGQTRQLVNDSLDSLNRILEGVSLLRELTPRSSDLILSFGERLSAPILAAALRDRGLEAKSLTGKEAGIITDDSFGEALPDTGRTRTATRKALTPLLAKGVVPVVAGFIAGTSDGEVTTLGRGGSDYTATILADALGADEVWIWTDVNGLLTADPRIVREAVVVKELSYAEAEEMAIFGAKNMHPLALTPARLHQIPVRIKNGFAPELPGTLIHQVEKKRAGIAKTVAFVGEVGMVTVSGETLTGRPGMAAKIFQALGANGVNVLMISQSVSESNISFVVRKDSLPRAVSALKSGPAAPGSGLKVEEEKDVAVLAAVGAGMKGTPGIAAKVFEIVARRGINVRMIAQGSSELNISFVVKESDAKEAVRMLHAGLLMAG